MVPEGLLAEKLAAATAVPGELRTPEVESFVQCFALQEELVGMLQACQASPLDDRLTCLAAVKLVQANHVCATPSLVNARFRDLFLVEALARAREYCARSGGTASWPPLLQLAALLRADCSLGTVLRAAAGMPTPPEQHGNIHFVSALLGALQQPGVRRQLATQLAELQAGRPAPCLTYNHLLAYIAEHAVHVAIYDGATSPAAQAVFRAAVELLPHLAVTTDQPPAAALRLHASAGTAAVILNHPNVWGLWTACYEAAERAGSDYFQTDSGYALAWQAALLSRAAAPPPDPPAAVLGWLRQARAAHSRCKRLLPRMWLANLDDHVVSALETEAWLENVASAEGGAWQQAGADMVGRVQQRSKDIHQQLLADAGASLRCDGCGKAAAHLRRCSACRQVQYCSVECQHAHWRGHKAACRRQQKEQAAGGAG